MATVNGPDMSSTEAVKALSSGINTRTATAVLNETASGSTNINIMRMPGGAEIVGMELMISNDIKATTGDALITVVDSLGNTWIQTASASGAIMRFNPTYASMNVRLTSSATLIVAMPGGHMNGTGTASTNFKLTCHYLTEKDPD